MTQRELAEAAGVSIPAVSKSKKLPVAYDAEGRRVFDPNDIAVQNFIRSKNDNRKKAWKATGKRAIATETPTPKRAARREGTVRQAARTHLEQTDPLQQPKPRKPTTQTNPADMDLDDQKTAEQIEKLRLENAETRKDLVPRSDVRAFLMELYGVHTSILRPLAQKIGRDVAMALGLTNHESTLAAEEIVDREVYDALNSIKTQITAFLRAIEAEAMLPEPAA